MVFLFLTGRFYEAEICAILLPLNYTFAWYPVFLPKSNFSVSRQTPWTVVKSIDQISFRTRNSPLEGATKLKFGPFCSFGDAFVDKARVPLNFHFFSRHTHIT